MIGQRRRRLGLLERLLEAVHLWDWEGADFK